MADIQPTQQKKGIPFATLQKGIRDWLQSDIVTDVIVLLNERYGAFGSEVRILPRLITRLAVGMTPPELFTKELGHYLAFMKEEDTYKLAFDIKSRIFKPIRAVLKSSYDIDTDKIITTPPLSKSQPRVMKIETPVDSRPDVPAPLPAAPTAVRQPTPPAPKAHVMEIQHVVDLRRPAAQAPLAAPTKTSTQNIKVPASARVTEMSWISEQRPLKTNQPAPSTQNSAISKKTIPEPNVIESPKAFGLAESIPKPPARVPQIPVTQSPTIPEHHELEEYHDEHPEVIANKEAK